MLKKITKLVTLYSLFVFSVQADFKIAVPVQAFRSGTIITVIALDAEGNEYSAGKIVCDGQTTDFSLDKISLKQPVDISDACEQLQIIDNADEPNSLSDNYVYLSVQDDSGLVVTRAQLVRMNHFAEPAAGDTKTVQKFMFADEDEDDFFNSKIDDLNFKNLNDLKSVEPVPLSTYDSVLLTVYAVWAIQTAKIKQIYKNFVTWLSSSHE